MIGVCIKYFHENYGGMLQAYATIIKLEKMGLDYELIQYEKCYSLCGKLKQLFRIFNVILLNDKIEALKKRIGKLRHPEFARNDSIRLASFRHFNETHFTKLSPIFQGYDDLCAGASRYDAIITGSDQLWSPAGLPTNYYNLMFVPDEIKKNSIASSFGVKGIPWYQISRTREYLKRFDFISMREDSGSEIVKELTGLEVPTILDPVFFFDEEGWKQLIPDQTVFSGEDYIFAYFLGANEKYRDSVKQAAKTLGRKIVALRHLDQYIESDETFGDYAPYEVDPARFLNILRNARYVCTDSFHGSAFSIIHHKLFVTFNRYAEDSKYSKNSRIDSLFKNLGLQDRRYKESLNLEVQLNSNIDYEAVDYNLNRLKKLTDDYLNTSLLPSIIDNHL